MAATGTRRVEYHGTVASALTEARPRHPIAVLTRSTVRPCGLLDWLHPAYSPHLMLSWARSGFVTSVLVAANNQSEPDGYLAIEPLLRQDQETLILAKNRNRLSSSAPKLCIKRGRRSPRHHHSKSINHNNSNTSQHLLVISTTKKFLTLASNLTSQHNDGHWHIPSSISVLSS